MLADDHPVVREGLRRLLESQSGMQIAGEADDGLSAVALVRALQPDVLVLDLSMPLLGGLDVVKRLAHERAATRIVVLTVHEEAPHLRQLLEAGIAAYVLKRSAADDLIRAVRAAAADETFIDPALSGLLVSGYLEGAGASRDGEPSVLSAREREVLVHIARGFSNRETAEALSLSVKTVETYKARMCEKLGLRSRIEIVRYAMRRGWLASA